MKTIKIELPKDAKILGKVCAYGQSPVLWVSVKKDDVVPKLRWEMGQ